jgi:hypothetical protein
MRSLVGSTPALFRQFSCHESDFSWCHSGRSIRKRMLLSWSMTRPHPAQRTRCGIHMKQKLAILLWGAMTERSQLFDTPFVHAATEPYSTAGGAATETLRGHAGACRLARVEEFAPLGP